jgi:hypothetical protein
MKEEHVKYGWKLHESMNANINIVLIGLVVVVVRVLKGV